LITERKTGVLYRVDHSGDYFWIVHNEDALNFKLCRTRVDTPHKKHWETVIEHSPERYLVAVSCYKNHVIVEGRRNGLTSIEILELPANDSVEHKWHPVQIEWEEAIYCAETGTNKIFDLTQLRIEYSSLITPPQVIDYELKTKRKILRKEKPVPNYNREFYATQRIIAKAQDGTQIPVSIVYRRDRAYHFTEKNAIPNKVFLTGYGAYGYSYDPDFDFQRLPLLDRGIVCAIAHIRGGGEMGRHWYENGKYLHKKNTFTDFIAVAEHLIQTGFTTKEQLAITGGSAGGLLMGAVLNLRPDLFKAMFTRVPFVDLMGSMSDASIPLTAGEWDEWGDPRQEKFYPYMLSYSPYDNLKPQDYPPMLVTAGLHDTRVGYWEPMKWVAKLRTIKTDKHPILFKCKFSGHFGSSGRYAYLEEKAFEYVWILNQLGIYH